MPRIAFLVPGPNSGRPANDNHERLPRTFEAGGWTVARVDRESLALEDRCLVAETVAGRTLPLAGFELYFMLGFGAKATLLDRLQLLRSLDQRRFVNTVDALLHQHGKVSLVLACPDVPQPVTYLGNDPVRLTALVAKGGDWIAKPPASSFGRDVFRLRHGEPNMQAILEHLTRDGRYALLQEHVEAGAGGEKRVLVAAGEIVGSYGKDPVDHRSNLGTGATAHPVALSAGEQATVERLASQLDSLGVRFAAVDLADRRVLEINVANPGWLQTYEAVSGVDLAPQAVDALTRWAGRLR